MTTDSNSMICLEKARRPAEVGLNGFADNCDGCKFVERTKVAISMCQVVVDKTPPLVRVLVNLSRLLDVTGPVVKSFDFDGRRRETVMIALGDRQSAERNQTVES